MSDVLYILRLLKVMSVEVGGDIDHDIIGSWVGDRVAVVGDYFDEEKDNPLFKGLYEKVESKNSGYKNISPAIRSNQKFLILNKRNG